MKQGSRILDLRHVTVHVGGPGPLWTWAAAKTVQRRDDGDQKGSLPGSAEAMRGFLEGRAARRRKYLNFALRGKPSWRLSAWTEERKRAAIPEICAHCRVAAAAELRRRGERPHRPLDNQNLPHHIAAAAAFAACFPPLPAHIKQASSAHEAQGAAWDPATIIQLPPRYSAD